MNDGTHCYLQPGDYMFITNMQSVQCDQEHVSSRVHQGTGTGLSCLLLLRLFNDFLFCRIAPELMPMSSSHISSSQNECTKAFEEK